MYAGVTTPALPRFPTVLAAQDLSARFFRAPASSRTSRAGSPCPLVCFILLRPRTTTASSLVPAHRRPGVTACQMLARSGEPMVLLHPLLPAHGLCWPR